MAPTTPKKKPSQHQRELAKARAARTSPRNAYLVVYNALSALGWAYVLGRLVAHFAVGGEPWSVKGAVGMETLGEQVLARSRTAFADFGDVVKWVQTAALLEIVHSSLGLVRSGLATTIAQLASRILVVWYVCPFYPQVAASPFYCSMVFAWSFTEVVRYCHYAVGLLNLKIPALEWLRYSAFYIMYPMGAGSEAALIFFSAAHARHFYGLPGFFATVALVSIWPPALLVMMGHMRRQRYHHLINPKGKKPSSGGKAKLELEAQASAVEIIADVTPARVTRSRSKAPLNA